MISSIFVYFPPWAINSAHVGFFPLYLVSHQVIVSWFNQYW